MTISFELPQDIGQQIRTNGADLNGKAREAFLSRCTVKTQLLTASSAEHSAWTAMTPTGCSRSTVPIWKSPSRNFGPKLRHSEM